MLPAGVMQHCGLDVFLRVFENHYSFLSDLGHERHQILVEFGDFCLITGVHSSCFVVLFMKVVHACPVLKFLHNGGFWYKARWELSTSPYIGCDILGCLCFGVRFFWVILCKGRRQLCGPVHGVRCSAASYKKIDEARKIWLSPAAHRIQYDLFFYIFLGQLGLPAKGISWWRFRLLQLAVICKIPQSWLCHWKSLQV